MNIQEPLTEAELGLLKTSAVRHAKSLGLVKYEVVIPQESQDWGLQFHPDYNEVVNTAEIHTEDGCVVLVVNSDYFVIDSDEVPFSYDF